MATIFIDAGGFKHSAITKHSLVNDPRYAKIRANAAEFGTAGKAVKLIRSAFHRETTMIMDPRITPRMQKLMLQVVKSDPLHGPGTRAAQHGNLQLLEGFEFNAAANLVQIIGAAFTVTVDRVKRKVALSLPAFLPAERLCPPPGCTHYELIVAASEVDFAGGGFQTVRCGSGQLPIGDKLSAPLQLQVTVSKISGLPIFVVAGIRFCELINSCAIPTGNLAFNALHLCKVDM